MNQKEFVKEVAYKFKDVSPSYVKDILDAMEEVITEAIRDEDSVKLFKGFTIYGHRTQPIKTVKAYDGTPMIIPPHIEPRVKFGYLYKKRVRQGYRDHSDE